MTSSEDRPRPMGSEANDNFIETPLKQTNNELQKMTLENDINKTVSNITTDNKSHPCYEKWKLGIKDLLEDDQGYRTFYEFLETEQLGVLFECWHSCEQYRRQLPHKATAKEVYSRFVRIKDSRVPISDQARNNLALRLRANDITEHLLLEIESEVFGNLRDICYPKFLKSDFFTFYCETSGQIQYEASDFHKFGKPTTKRGSNLSALSEHEQSMFDRSSNDLRPSSLAPYEREIQVPDASKIQLEIQSLSSDAFSESGRISMTDSRVSCGHHHSRGSRTCNHDQLPDLANFKPRTQRMNQDRMRQMKPQDFARLLIEKLEKVIYDRETEFGKLNQEQNYQDQSRKMYNTKPTLPQNTQIQNFYPCESEPSLYDSETQSWAMPPASDRYSVAGASSHSGSGAHVEHKKYRNIKEKAKELRNAVHHSLRNGLGECQCQSCYDLHEKICNEYTPMYSDIGMDCCQSKHMQCCYHNNSISQPVLDERSLSKFNTDIVIHRQAVDDYPHQDVPIPIDNTKIFAWMEKNEKYKNQASYPDPAPSPALRRKKQPVVYDTSRPPQGVQPIAQDLGMPILPQPDTGTVLEEVKRVLEEPKQRVSSRTKKVSTPRTRQHHISNNSGYFNDQHSGYSDPSYEKPGSVVSSWSGFDAASSLSYNPSQISTVPSSASRLWNQQGYYESRSNIRNGYKSDTKSHSTGRHSGPHIVSRTDRHSSVHSDHHPSRNSDIHSQSTARSHGSGSSKGHTKNMTTVTYYFGVDPIPFRISIPSNEVTLGLFKVSFTKKGNFRFFFKTISEDDGEVVYEEVKTDDELLPWYKDKIIGKVEM